MVASIMLQVLVTGKNDMSGPSSRFSGGSRKIKVGSYHDQIEIEVNTLRLSS